MHSLCSYPQCMNKSAAWHVKRGDGDPKAVLYMPHTSQRVVLMYGRDEGEALLLHYHLTTLNKIYHTETFGEKTASKELETP